MSGAIKTMLEFLDSSLPCWQRDSIERCAVNAEQAARMATVFRLGGDPIRTTVITRTVVRLSWWDRVRLLFYGTLSVSVHTTIMVDDSLGKSASYVVVGPLTAKGNQLSATTDHYMSASP